VARKETRTWLTNDRPLSILRRAKCRGINMFLRWADIEELGIRLYIFFSLKERRRSVLDLKLLIRLSRLIIVHLAPISNMGLAFCQLP
jgi:hypothetical protein